MDENFREQRVRILVRPAIPFARERLALLDFIEDFFPHFFQLCFVNFGPLAETGTGFSCECRDTHGQSTTLPGVREGEGLADAGPCGVYRALVILQENACPI